MASKKNCSHVAPGWWCSPCLLTASAKGWLWLPTKHSFCKAGTSKRDLPDRPPGQLLWLGLGECLGRKATCTKRYLLWLTQWENWAQAFPPRCFPSAFEPKNRFVAKLANTWQAWTQDFLRIPLLTQQGLKMVKRPKPWVSKVLKWLKIGKKKVRSQNNLCPREVTLGLLSPKPAFQISIF